MEILLEAVVHPIRFWRWIRTMNPKLFLLWLIAIPFGLMFWRITTWNGQTHQNLDAFAAIFDLAFLVTSICLPFMIFFVGYPGRDDKFEQEEAKRVARKQAKALPH